MINNEQIKVISNNLRISEENLTKWSKNLLVKEYKIGEFIIKPDNLSKYIFILISGKIRIRGQSKDRKNTYTLNVIENNGVIGLASSKLNLPVEIASAGDNSSLLLVDKKCWDEFYKDIKSQYLYLPFKYVDISEIWFHINNTVENFKLKKENKNIRPFLTNYASLIKSFNNIEEFELEKEIKYKDYSLIVYAEGKDKFVFYPEINDDLVKNNFNSVNIKNILLFPKFNKDFNLNKLPQNSAIKDNTESLSAESAGLKDEVIDEEIEFENRKSSYRFYSSSKGKIEETVACFQMLASFLDLPIRKESIEKLLLDNSKSSSKEIEFELCAAIAESLGVKTQLAKIPNYLFYRSLTPFFFKNTKGKIFICLEIKKNKLIIGDPNDSIKELTFDELKNNFDFKDDIETLIFQRTNKTPSKVFGLNWFKPAIKKHKKALIEVLIASIFVQLFQVMNPLIIQQIIDKVIGQNGMNTLPALAILLFTFSVFENVLTAVRTNLFIDTTNRIDLSLGEQVIDHLLRLPLTYFDKRPVGELSSRLAEMEQIRSFLTGTALTVLLDSIFSVVYIAIMLVYSWVLTIVALLVAPILAALTFLVSPIIRKQIRRKAELNAQTQNHLVETLTGIQTVKAQNIELNSRYRWRKMYTKYISEGYKNAITSTTSSSLSQFLNQASSLAVLCVGTFLVLKGQLSLGQLIAFRIISGYVTTPLLRLANLYQSFQQTAISIERLGDILNNTQESTKVDKLNIPMKSINGQVNYKNVSFGFNPKGALQLTQINLEISSGEFVAVVGQSGSGKSTLMKLLSRLYEPTSGKITIDNFDIAKVELYSLRRQIGIVPQDSLLFDGSVENNIALTKNDSSSDEIIKAAKVACAHDFIMNLPVGYASKVGERGTSLSGGQRQRIAIARTVLQNPNLLIMDEATSALDYETERKVSLNLMEYFRGKTVFFITHRLTSITHADRIIMMHKGNIDEQGTHEELINKKGRYYALFNQQNGAKNII